MAEIDMVAWVRSLKKGDKATEPPLTSMNKLADELQKTRDELASVRAELAAVQAECAKKHSAPAEAKSSKPRRDEEVATKED